MIQSSPSPGGRGSGGGGVELFMIKATFKFHNKEEIKWLKVCNINSTG